MQDLPVPRLADTLERYDAALAPLLSPTEQKRTAEVIRRFLSGPGPAVQDRLEDLATREAAQGRSWLTRMWVDMYLSTREPLQLVSSVAFQITWPTAASGAAAAADFIHRIAAVHLEYLRGELSPSVGTRGEPLTFTQWHHLSGGLRRPHPTRDLFEPGPASASNRTAVVLHRGRAWSLPVSGTDGHPMPVAALARALTQIVADPTRTEGTFLGLTAASSAVGAAVLDARLTTEQGRATYAALREALFAVDLSKSSKSDSQNLRDLAFDPSGVLAHKTTSYRVDLESGFVGVNLEHSVTDGATLIELVARAKRIVAVNGDPASTIPAPLNLTQLVWPDIPGESAAIGAARAEFAQRADSLAVEILTTAGLPDGIASHDGAMQWILLYAAICTWGQARSTYEAVDMRHYRAGRTESFRPHTTAAVKLVSHLVAGSATQAHLDAAARAHSDLIKGAKTGQGIERHLHALHRLATESGEEKSLFTDPGYARLTENFLSTTSLGSPIHLTRCAFVPPAPGGLGINYTRVHEHYEFCISYDAAADPGVEEFTQHLHRGARALGDLVRGLTLR